MTPYYHWHPFPTLFESPYLLRFSTDFQFLKRFEILSSRTIIIETLRCESFFYQKSIYRIGPSALGVTRSFFPAERLRRPAAASGRLGKKQKYYRYTFDSPLSRQMLNSKKWGFSRGIANFAVYARFTLSNLPIRCTGHAGVHTATTCERSFSNAGKQNSR